ncbi:hypothetical protein I204_07484 [Kwoniella mangroviensis CBS 8886]|uniref:hypothetical protein n=1 Tax=Kwoniella mangroviensis CBS 8507 TaxID=1296122 RepID=UPI00080CC600|nr:uncharacterized protein I203_08523 [Kwoniella mangroviensis CBS 8507]OCF62397.1 hypothetical protein I203_08523 [Kwoniella mangroviensis CBS 8507]OCF72219.1 hypothetical protein I204_07484 [Kwoniella mangroviensis CBS 8886]
MSTRLPAPSVAGPSNTPRNPVKLSVVAQQSSPQASSSRRPLNETDYKAEDDILIKAAVRKAQLQRRVDRWMDKLMEETVDRNTFKKITSHLTPAQYQELIHERHLNSLCSYPLCPNKPRREYSDKKRLSISTTNRTIKEKQGNPEDGFCCEKCKKRSEWVESTLSEEAVWLRREIKEVELLEELEESGMFTWPEHDKRKRSEGVKNGLKSRNTPSISRTDAITSMPQPVHNDTPVQSSTLPPKPSAAPDNPVSALIANLTIHERPTPSTPPIAPSISQPTPSYSSPPPKSIFPTPQARTTSTPANAATEVTPRESRRAQTALIGTSSKLLSNSFVNATRSLGSIGLSQGESDVDEESEASDWDHEMDGGWDDEDMKGFWEEARLTRELVEEEETANKDSRS